MSESTTLADQRKNPREQTLGPGIFCVGDRELDCKVLDMSVGGAKVRLVEPVEVDTRIALTRFGTRFKGRQGSAQGMVGFAHRALRLRLQARRAGIYCLDLPGIRRG